jgi:membrane protein YqaA with SNARE-associated domain
MLAAGNLLESSDFLLGSLLLALALMLGGAVIWMMDRWRKRQDAEIERNAMNSFAHYRELYEEGELSEEEYERIRAGLHGGTRKPPEPTSREAQNPDGSAPPG